MHLNFARIAQRVSLRSAKPDDSPPYDGRRFGERLTCRRHPTETASRLSWRLSVRSASAAAIEIGVTS